MNLEMGPFVNSTFSAISQENNPIFQTECTSRLYNNVCICYATIMNSQYSPVSDSYGTIIRHCHITTNNKKHNIFIYYYIVKRNALVLTNIIVIFKIPCCISRF